MLNDRAGALLVSSILVVGLTQIGTPTAHSATATSGWSNEQERPQDPPEMAADFVGLLVETKKLTASDAAVLDEFGFRVAISGDTVVVGAKRDSNAALFTGAAYVFERNQDGTDSWGQVKKLTASDPEDNDEFGNSVGISGDTVVVGAWHNDDACPTEQTCNSGSAYVFDRNEGGTDNWGEVKKLTASDAAEGDEYAVSVGISGNTVVVGAHSNDDAGSGSGSAYVYYRDEGGAGNWGEVKKLTASDAAPRDAFGDSVAISGDTLVAGSINNRDAGSSSGSAYVFDRDQGGPDNWGEVKKLTAADAAAEDYFGWSVGISGDTVVVGADYDDDAGPKSGSAYVFERNHGGVNNWGEASKLTASDGSAYDNFGSSVATSGDTVVVGAWHEDDGGTNAGAAYVFRRDVGGPDNWGQDHKLTVSDAAERNETAVSVAISGSIVLVGAANNAHAGPKSGSAYLYGPRFGGFYVLDGFGGVHPGGGAASLVNSEPPSFGFDVARDVELAGLGAYVLDGFGGVHRAGGAPALFSPPPPYFGFDIARDIELSDTGAYVLDGFGGVHSVGGAPALTSPPPPYFGFDIARDMELATTGLYVLDGFGGIHAVGGAPALGPPPAPYFGIDAARDMEMAATTGLYVLEGFGSVHAVGGAPALGSEPPYFGFDAAVDLELATTGFYVLDGFGGVHARGGAPTMNPSTSYFGWHISRDLELQ